MERTTNKKIDLRSEAGFTLMELIVVIAIIAILIGILLPRFSGMNDKANSVSAASDARAAFTSLTSYVTAKANDRNDSTLEMDKANAKIADTLGYASYAEMTAGGNLSTGGWAAEKGNAKLEFSSTKGGLTYTFTLDTSKGNINKVVCTGDKTRCESLIGEGVVTETTEK